MNKRKRISQTIITVFTCFFFISGIILFVGSLIGYLLSQGGSGEISPDYMGGVIVTNILSAYSTIIFIISLICFGIAGYLSKLLK